VSDLLNPKRGDKADAEKEKQMNRAEAIEALIRLIPWPERRAVLEDQALEDIRNIVRMDDKRDGHNTFHLRGIRNVLEQLDQKILREEKKQR